MKNLLKVENIVVEFDTPIQRVKALNGVSMFVNKGEIVGLMGPSGSGKSTIVNTVLGLFSAHQRTSGQVFWGDKTQNRLEQSDQEWRAFRQSHVTCIFQNAGLNLNPSLSIEKHFERIFKSKSSTSHSIGELLDSVGLEQPQQILNSYPHQLSGGQLQRIMMATAIAQEVDLLLLDEPLSSLDSENQTLLIDLILDLNKSLDISFMVISHNLDVIQRLASRVYVIDQGNIVDEGKMADLLARPQSAIAKALVTTLLAKGTEGVESPTNPILEVSNLTHSFKKGGFLSRKKSFDVLQNLSLTVAQGEILGIVGPSGGGKSTLVQLLQGSLPIQEGSILFNGQSISVLQKQKSKLLKRIQLLHQDAYGSFNPKLLIGSQLKELIGQDDESLAEMKGTVQSVGLETDLLDRYSAELSGGQIQRMAIARALLVKPDVLILDESLTGLDTIVQRAVIDLLLALNTRTTITMIIISHDRKVIDYCCHRVLTLSEGRLE